MHLNSPVVSPKPSFSSVGLHIQRCRKHKSLPSSCLCYQVAHSKSLTEKEVGLEFMQQMLSVSSFLGRCFLTHWTQSKCDLLLLLHPQGLFHSNCGSQCACYVSDFQTFLPFQGLCPLSPILYMLRASLSSCCSVCSSEPECCPRSSGRCPWCLPLDLP